MPLILPFIPVIQNTSLPAATVGTPYTATITSVSGVQPVTYAITSDSPNTGNWLSINPTTGVLSGTPTTAETESVTIVATDALNQLSAPANFTLTVNPAITFNFFISPNGIDTNPGTLSQPWSLSALTSKMSTNTYRGLNIGLIGDQGPFQYVNPGSGQLSIYSQIQGLANANGNSNLFQIQGGTSNTARTVLASCNSSGQYQPRLAVIDPRDPVTLALPTNGVGTIGQSIGNMTGPYPTLWGNITLDGIVVTYPCQGGIFWHATSPVVNLTIKNCELYADMANPQVTGNGNVAAIKLYMTGGGDNIQALNNKVHDFTDAAGPGSLVPWDYHGLFLIGAESTGARVTNIIFKNNTFYNIGTGITFKDSWNYSGEVSYNYLDCGSFGSAMSDGSTVQAVRMLMVHAPNTVNFHHNICFGQISCVPVGFLAGDSTGAASGNSGTVSITNNTVYCPHQPCLAWRQTSASTGPGTYTFQNNLVYGLAGYSAAVVQTIWLDRYGSGFDGITSASCDFNYYGNGVTFARGSAGTVIPQSQWTGSPNFYDSHTTFFSGSPFLTTPQPLQWTTFAVGPGANVGVNGATCGAVDGSGPIGCNF